MPLFLQSKRIVKKHHNCFSTILKENSENIPLQLQKTLFKGKEGLKSYGLMLENIDDLFKRNKMLIEQLNSQNQNIKKT